MRKTRGGSKGGEIMRGSKGTSSVGGGERHTTGKAEGGQDVVAFAKEGRRTGSNE